MLNSTKCFYCNAGIENVVEETADSPVAGNVAPAEETTALGPVDAGLDE